MLDINIDQDLRAHAPDLVMGCITATVAVTEHDDQLWQAIDTHIRTKAPRDVAEIASLPEIIAQRRAYKACGKDPGRYRSAAEALLRRVAQGKGLYQVNTLVDINNLLSLETHQPFGSYDLDKLQPSIVFRRGMAGESYKGIGKGMLNLENLPLFADQSGPFGSPTSDSERALITQQTSRILMVVMAFTGAVGLDEILQRGSNFLTRFATASEIRSWIVK